jgi:hypothetical protein
MTITISGKRYLYGVNYYLSFILPVNEAFLTLETGSQATSAARLMDTLKPAF